MLLYYLISSTSPPCAFAPMISGSHPSGPNRHPPIGHCTGATYRGNDTLYLHRVLGLNLLIPALPVHFLHALSPQHCDTPILRQQLYPNGPLGQAHYTLWALYPLLLMLLIGTSQYRRAAGVFPLRLFHPQLAGDENHCFDAFQILEVDLWKRGPNLADIGTFAVPLSTYVLIETHIKEVCSTISYKDAVL